ncbi:MAG: trypsin-like peptidase domain-containing protein [Bdellovibrionales bacterium]
MIVSFKRILLNFYLVLQIFTVSMGLLCGFVSYAEKDPLKAFQNFVQENIPSGVEKVKNSVVHLFLTTHEGRSNGTGFILEDGILVTNAHVLLDKSYSSSNQINSGHLFKIKIFQEGRLLDVQVTSIQAVDPIHDLVLLNIKGDIPPAIKKSKGEVDLKKEKLFFVGYPHGKLKAMGQKGPIEIFESKNHAEIYMPVSTNDVSGASGSPIVNQKGELVGALHSTSTIERKIIFSKSDSLFSLRNAEYGVQCSKNTSIKDCFQQMEDFHLKEALKGDAYAQYKLSSYHHRNFRYKKALKWSERAAQQGFVLAQYHLAYRFYSLKSYKEAIKWLELASQNGYKTSMNLLGSMYYQGQGVPQDYKKAMKFFKAASSQKSITDSKYTIASMYARGEGVSKNHKEAIRWHQLAVESGSLKSLAILGAYYYFGTDETPQDYKKAFKYFKTAAQHGSKEVYYFLGVMHYEAEGVPQNYKKAMELFGISARQGSSNAKYMLGLMYSQGQGAPQDTKISIGLMKQAAQQGNKQAQKYLSKLKDNKCVEVFNKGVQS